MKIETVVEQSDDDKSLESDGFNFAFVNKFWYLIKDEVRIMFDQFHRNETILKGMLVYFVVLISKVNSSMELKDYRPIFLLACVINQ